MQFLIPVFGIVSVLLLILAGPSYFLGTIRGEIKPQRATWFIWSVLGATAFVSQAELGGSWSLLFIGVEGLGNLAMFLLSLKYGVGGWTRLDRWALALAALGITASVAVHEPFVALIGVMIADLAGITLTVIKAYRQPTTEAPLVWVLNGTSAVFALLAVGKVDLSLWVYPIYFALSNYSIASAQQLGERRLRTNR